MTLTEVHQDDFYEAIIVGLLTIDPSFSADPAEISRYGRIAYALYSRLGQREDIELRFYQPEQHDYPTNEAKLQNAILQLATLGFVIHWWNGVVESASTPELLAQLYRLPVDFTEWISWLRSDLKVVAR